MFYEVREIDLWCAPPDDRTPSICNIAALIRESFADVAVQFHLSPSNCPRHPAFLSESAAANSLHQPGVISFGAFCDAQLIGFAALVPLPGAYELTRLCVLPEHRRAGVGEMLLHKAFTCAKAQGAEQMEIGIIAAHTSLKKWYIRHGFYETAERNYSGLPFLVCHMTREI